MSVRLFFIALVLALPGCGSLIVTQQSVESLAERRGFAWEQHHLDGIVLYVEAGSAAGENVPQLGADVVAARDRVVTYLQAARYEPTVSIFVVESRDRMKDLIGRPTNAMAFYKSNAICLVWSDEVRVGATLIAIHERAVRSLVDDGPVEIRHGLLAAQDGAATREVRRGEVGPVI